MNAGASSLTCLATVAIAAMMPPFRMPVVGMIRLSMVIRNVNSQSIYSIEGIPSWRITCAELRAFSSARVSCAANDLQCNDLNQPSRISWAMIRASFLSVFTGIVLKSLRTCRFSSSSAGRPSASRPVRPLRNRASL